MASQLRGVKSHEAEEAMRPIRSDDGSTDNQGAPETIFSEPVLPTLRRRRSPEQSTRIALNWRILEFVEARRAAGKNNTRGRMD